MQTMQAIVETTFDVVYLITVILLGVRMKQRSKGNKQYYLFGVMAVVLGVGDAFHLVPRAVALCTSGLESFTGGLTAAIFGLSALRIVLCLFPQNAWTSAQAPLSWGIYRNIPFTILGILMIYLFYREARVRNDKAFRNMWLTIVLSFAFYLPVVLFADQIPVIGMLMIPKTCAYVWTVWIGYQAMKEENL